MLTIRRLFGKPVSLVESGAASDASLPMLNDLEKSEHASDHMLSPPPRYLVQRRKLSSNVKLFLIALTLIVTLLYGRSITNYATLSYDAILHAKFGHTACDKPAGLDRPITITASPITTDPVGAKLLSKNGWVATCSSSVDNDRDCKFAITDPNDGTEWQSKDADSGTNHWIVIDLKKKSNIHSVSVKPGEDWAKKGGSVRKHQVEVATELGKWTLVAFGSWREDGNEEKFATFEPRPAQFVRITIIDTSMTKKFVIVSGIDVWEVEKIPPRVENGGKWGVTLDFPLVPVTAWLNPKTRDLVTMSSYAAGSFEADKHFETLIATWSAGTQVIEQKVLGTTKHDMFCPGTSFDEKGRVIVTGGSTPAVYSIYDSETSTWVSLPDTKNKVAKPRGYQGQTYMGNGKTFMIGGEWSGGRGEKDGEIYDPVNQKWTLLPKIKADSIKMNVSWTCEDFKVDGCIKDDWRQHHAWLFAWKDNTVFHAGPSKQMNWFFPEVDGGTMSKGGIRQDHGDAVCGITSMYDAENGVILVAGGSVNYHYWFNPQDQSAKAPHRKEASKDAFEIRLGAVKPGQAVTPKRLTSMKYQRIFANSVIFPNGETLVVGGQSRGEPFYDESWQPTPEIYTPESDTWRPAANHSIPRGYHSWAMLLPDASVIVGGAGLQREETNHYDAQIYYPPYLFKSDGETRVEQPKIKPMDKRVYKLGDTITINSDVEIDGASLIRYSAATHALNNDLRRIKLKVVTQGNPSDKKYSFQIPDNSGVTLPGYWMLFVLKKSVPSIAETIQILPK